MLQAGFAAAAVCARAAVLVSTPLIDQELPEAVSPYFVLLLGAIGNALFFVCIYAVYRWRQRREGRVHQARLPHRRLMMIAMGEVASLLFMTFGALGLPVLRTV